MNMHLQGKVYAPYRLKPDRAVAATMLRGMGIDAPPVEVPPTYLIFLRGEEHDVDLFRDLDIPREKALHGGQRYEWLAPIGWDDEMEVTATVDKLTEKEGKAGKVWFADVSFEYKRVRDGKVALREVTRLAKRS